MVKNNNGFYVQGPRIFLFRHAAAGAAASAAAFAFTTVFTVVATVAAVVDSPGFKNDNNPKIVFEKTA